MTKKKQIIKEEKPEIKTYDIYIDSYSSEEYTTEADPEDRWSRSSTRKSWTFNRLHQDRGYDSVKVTFKPKNGQIYHVLLGIYSTGDSFGHDENARVEYFDIFEHYNDSRKSYEELARCSRYQYLLYTNHQGRPVKVYNPWNGYFESLSELRVESLTYVGDDRD